MPIIKPISDLRNKSKEVSLLVHESQEPVFITKDGAGDMVLMSMQHYSRMTAKIDLMGKLAVAQAARVSGDKGRPLSSVMTALRRKMHESR